MAMTIVERARRLIATCPGAISGQGGHSATFRVACALVWGYGLTPEEAMPLMVEYNATCQPPWSQGELWHKLRSALASNHSQARGHLLEGSTDKGEMPHYEAPKKKEKVTFDLEALKRAQNSEWKVDADFLRARSPIDPRKVTSGQVLDLLYAPDDRVMVFTSMRSYGDFMRWRGRWYALGKSPQDKAKPAPAIPEQTKEGMIWLVQPVDGMWHPVAGRPQLSRRTQRSIVSYPYLLLESDEAPADLWLNMLARLPLAVRAIVTSGGRSVHALVHLGCETHAQWRECVEVCRDTLAALGCDSQALSNPAVNMRLPNVLREGKMVTKYRDGRAVLDSRGKPERELRRYDGGPMKQRLLYLNPRAQAKPIGEGAVYSHD